jgi:hypothetical protein
MHINVRVHHWVLWWSCVGIVCGAVALVNILVRSLTPTQVNAILAVGVFFWLLVGVACYAYEGIKVDAVTTPPKNIPPHADLQPLEWHFASEFLLPGNRKSLLPPKY